MESKEKFIDKLMSMTEDDIQEYIKKNGKTIQMTNYSFSNGII